MLANVGWTCTRRLACKKILICIICFLIRVRKFLLSLSFFFILFYFICLWSHDVYNLIGYQSNLYSRIITLTNIPFFNKKIISIWILPLKWLKFKIIIYFQLNHHLIDLFFIFERKQYHTLERTRFLIFVKETWSNIVLFPLDFLYRFYRRPNLCTSFMCLFLFTKSIEFVNICLTLQVNIHEYSTNICKVRIILIQVLYYYK